MLVDCGPNKTVLARLGNYLSFFDRTIDYLVITHPDLDHYGGCADVVQRYHVKNILENGDQSKTDSYFSEWNKVADVSGANRQIVKDFDNWDIASTTINWLYPNSNVKVEKDDSNNRSIVFKLTDIFGSFMFTGDAEIPLENALLKKYCVTASTASSPPPLQGGGIVASPLLSKEGVGGGFVCPTIQADYLKVGHHGSDSSSGVDWLAVVAPKTVVVSVGKNNFGHPSLRVMRNILRAGAEILRTDEIGDIIAKP